jgi:hypothetical protein
VRELMGQWPTLPTGNRCRLSRPARLLVLVLALAAPAAFAAKQTVCTVTVNSSDEKESFRRHLPADRFDFVELVEHGRPDWLRSACERKVSCDVLVISGHFAGTEFYSSRPEVNETLPVDEMERATCGACPDLFAHLKEVYLFGCDSLKDEPVRTAVPEIVRGLVAAGASPADAERFAKALSRRQGEDARDRMRRVFAGVPVIYGFSSLAPYGRTAGPLLERYFVSGPEEVGSGEVSARLLRLFGPSSMIATRGERDGDPGADYRAQACRFYGDVGAAAKMAEVHRELAGDMAHVRMAFDRVEKYFASLDASRRDDRELAAALSSLVDDTTARGNYLAVTRATEDSALRVRMIALARGVGWLDAAGQHAELVRTISDLLASRSLGYGDVDLVCTLNGDRKLDDALERVVADGGRDAPREAGLACLGNAQARSRVLRLLASADDSDVQVAEAYLRHRPITDPAELRAAAKAITQMKTTPAQVRALDALGRLHVADREIAGELAALFARTPSLAVQRAIAEVFLRGDPGTIGGRTLAELLRRHRLHSPDGEDLIDQLVRRLS